MKIGIGSKNKAKIIAVKSAFEKLCKTFSFARFDEIEFISVSTLTSVPDMPLSTEQMVEGAIQRAQYLFWKIEGIDYALGLEGGTFPLQTPSLNDRPHYFLQNWVYAFDGTQGYLGSSPALTLPETIVRALYHDHRELAEIIDEFSGKTDVRSNEGAFGVLTHDLLKRSASFEMAVMNAMVPFLNGDYGAVKKDNALMSSHR